MFQVIVPAFNEKTQLPDMIRNLCDVLDSQNSEFQILVVDDGSTDGMTEELEKLKTKFPISISRHAVNMGVSAAFRTGFDAVIGKLSDQDQVLTIEANRSIDVTIIPEMIRKSRQGYDLVLASCYAPGGNVIGDPFLRLFFSVGANRLLRFIFPFQNIHTYTSFYRLWKPALIRMIHMNTGGRYFEQEGFACMADMLIKATRIPGVKIVETPLILRSDIGDAGSKMKVAKTIMKYIKLIMANISKR